MEISEKLAKLPEMGKSALCDLWRTHFKRVAPAGIRKELMIRMLAYRIQEEAFGGLDPKISRRLAQIANSLSKNPKMVLTSVARASTGTQLIRSWQGKTHTVTVEESGYQYQGRKYRSLSEIARHITGTQWSGPLFFGLKSRQQKKGIANVL
jgi:hypothetical protein